MSSSKICISVLSIDELENKLKQRNFDINNFDLIHVVEKMNGDFEINEISIHDAKKILIDYVEIDIVNNQIYINDSLCF